MLDIAFCGGNIDVYLVHVYVENAMASLNFVARALERLVLLPGDTACNVMNLPGAEYRDLVRMLINSLFWMLLSITVIALTA
jgi:hypothetical protein